MPLAVADWLEPRAAERVFGAETEPLPAGAGTQTFTSNRLPFTSTTVFFSTRPSGLVCVSPVVDKTFVKSKVSSTHLVECFVAAKSG